MEVPLAEILAVPITLFEESIREDPAQLTLLEQSIDSLPNIVLEPLPIIEVTISIDVFPSIIDEPDTLIVEIEETIT